VQDCLPLGLQAGAGAQDLLNIHLIADGSQQPQRPDWYGYRPI